MKKLIFFAMALIVSINLIAQTSEEWKLADERIAKLEKLQESPKASGLVTVDGIASMCAIIAGNSVEISTLLKTLQFRAGGDKAEGVRETVAKLPTQSELKELNTRVVAQAQLIKSTGGMIPAATQEVKAIKNPLKMRAPMSCLNYSKKVLAVAADESAFQAKTITDLMKLVSGRKKK